MKIDEDVKSGKFSKVYLLYGEESYLINQKKRLLINTLRGADDMNYEIWNEDSPPAGAIIDFAETLPFLSDHRIALISGSGYFKKAAPDELVEYMSQIPETTILIFTEEEVDKRSKLYKAIDKNGTVVEFPREDENNLTKWLVWMFKNEKKSCSREVIADILSRTGNDMAYIKSEMDKLFAFCLDRDRVTKEDLDAVMSSINTDTIFNLTDAVAAKDTVKVFSLYRILLDKKEAPLRILWHMTRRFEMLLQIQELDKEGFGLEMMADKMGVKSWQIRKNLSQARKFKAKDLRTLLEKGALADQNVKSGIMTENTSVELFLVSCCQAS